MMLTIKYSFDQSYSCFFVYDPSDFRNGLHSDNNTTKMYKKNTQHCYNIILQMCLITISLYL